MRSLFVQNLMLITQCQSIKDLWLKNNETMSKSIWIMNNFETVTTYFEKHYIYATLFLLILKVTSKLI